MMFICTTWECQQAAIMWALMQCKTVFKTILNLCVSSPETWLADQTAFLFNQHFSPVWCIAVDVQTVDTTIIWDILPCLTGPKVVSKDITVESIEEVSKILRRAPVIWDNIHANDYDQKRLFLGPYKGRSTELIPRLKGVLTNPNCEFESNFVAIHTLATWYKSNMNGVRKDVVMSKLIKICTWMWQS